MSRRRLLINILFILLAVTGLAFYLCWDKTPYAQVVKPDEAEHKIASQAITLVAAGDCLMHNTQIWSGEQEDGSYNFDCFFTEVSDYISRGDYSTVCFEAPMAGPATGYTGYPLFNSPDSMADTLKKAGFDLVVTAHNHTLDRGYQGLIRTLDVLHERGLDTVGTYKTLEDSQKYLIKDIKGVKVAYIAYSYSTNGIPVPEDHSYCFNYLDEDKILEDIRILDEQVDIVVLVLHWGVEYTPAPTPEQIMSAHKFLEAGADVILGSHPHVIQTMEVVNINNQDKFIIYSMGNFISHQRGRERNSGIILQLTFSKDFDSGITVLEEASYIPTYSHHYSREGKEWFRVVPVEDTIQKITDGSEEVMSASDLPELQAVLAATREQLGEFYYRNP